MADLIQLRRGTAAEWAVVGSTRVLAQGEPGWDLTAKAVKFGDGQKTWNELPFYSAPAVVTEEYLIARPSVGADVTSVLQAKIDQIKASAALGGKILIPGGAWTFDGGIDCPDATSIEGVGKDARNGKGTRLTMNANLSASNATNNNTMAFNVGAMPGQAGVTRRNVSIRNLELNLANKSAAHGVLVTNPSGVGVYSLQLENLLIQYPLIGSPLLAGTAFRVEATTVSNPFECILADIRGCDFIGASRGFYCNTNNSGFNFTNILSSSHPGCIGLDVKIIGHLKVDDWLSVGNSAQAANNFATDGTAFLQTGGYFGNILIENCQTEKMEYFYLTGLGTNNYYNNYSRKALHFRGNLIQAKMKFTAQASVIDDNNSFVNFVGIPIFIDSNTGFGAGGVADPALIPIQSPWVHLYRISKSYVETRDSSGAAVAPELSNFANPYSRVIDQAGNINTPVIKTAPETTPVINASRGIVIAPTTGSTVTVYNTLVDTSSMVYAFKADNLGAVTVLGTQCDAEQFTIFLSGSPSVNTKIAFHVVKPVKSEGLSDLF